MSSPWTGTPKELSKWRVEAARSAAHLKSGKMPIKDTMKLAFAFNLGVICTFHITRVQIDPMSGPQLTSHIYEGVLAQFAAGKKP